MSCCQQRMAWTGIVFLFGFAAIIQTALSDTADSRLKNGRDADRGDLSFVVRIEKDGETHCNGVLFGKRTVLTTKQCVKGSLDKYRVALRGKGCDSKKCEETRRIDELLLPSFGDDDLIAVKLDRKINKKKYKTMKRLSEEKDQEKLTRCKVVGFSDEYSLREADITLLEARKCSKEDRDKILCLNVEKAAVCSEDKGSPVLCKYDDRWHVAGLLNTEKKCQRDLINAVQVSYYKAAILQKLFIWSGNGKDLFLLQGAQEPSWNSLKVTWSLNPALAFNDVPRTQREAEADDWVPFTPGAKCDDNAKFKGLRFIKDDDMGVIPIYDQAGYIAGIQIGFPKDYSPNPNNFPYAALKNAEVILDEGNYFLTAYFIDPAKICEGRTALEFAHEGTGTQLLLQNGLNPVSDYVTIPYTQTAVDKTMWTISPCSATMGTHYWYNLRQDMPCEEVYPLFLLYDNGQLNAFGWAFALDLSGISKRIENPPPQFYGLFLNPVPDCLYGQGTVTTLHIYLKGNPADITCAG